MSSRKPHNVEVHISSKGDNPSVDIKIKWDPEEEVIDVEKLGYYPAAYLFVEKFILPGLEEALKDVELLDAMFGVEEPTSVN